MNKAALILSIIFSWTILSSCATVAGEPLERFTPSNIKEAKKLEASLSGSEWVYSWRGREYNFQFNENGTIGILETWDGVRWYVSGKNDVVLVGEDNKMLLSFNVDFSNFDTRDWDGEKSSGRRTAI